MYVCRTDLSISYDNSLQNCPMLILLFNFSATDPQSGQQKEPMNLSKSSSDHSVYMDIDNSAVDSSNSEHSNSSQVTMSSPDGSPAT